MRAELRIKMREVCSQNFQCGSLAYPHANVQLAHAESFMMVVGIMPSRATKKRRNQRFRE